MTEEEILAQGGTQKPEPGQDQETSEANPESEPKTASEATSEPTSKENSGVTDSKAFDYDEHLKLRDAERDQVA